MKHSIIAAIILSAASASAQSITGGPVTGRVFDTATHSIRAIMGLPGAAYLGGAAASTWDLATPSPDGNKALALRGTELYLIPDLSQPDTATDLGQVIQTTDHIVWSADSSAAALFSSRSSQLQRISGLGGAASIESAIDLASAGSIEGWSIAPDGKSLAYSTPATNGGSVFLLTGSGPAVRAGAFTDPGALTFSSDGASLFVFDRATSRIVKLQVSTGAIVDSFAAGAAGSSAARTESTRMAATQMAVRRLPPARSAPVNISSLAQAGQNLVALHGQSVCVYDLSGQNSSRCQTIDVNASSLSAIGASVFVLNYPRSTSSPVWLWDGNSGEVYFVPSGRSAANASN